MSRELFIYWRAAATRSAEIERAARAFQAGWATQAGGRSAHLFLRVDAARPDRVTWMESYASVGGLDDPALTELATRSAAALSRWAEDGRHAEIFERLPP